MTPNRIQPYLDDIVAGRAKLELLIKNNSGHVSGVMRPLCLTDLNSKDIIQKLTDWRNQNRSCFLTEFTATSARTKGWLCNTVFRSPGQMLFLIYENDILVGHVGFKNLSEHDAVLDNAIKSVKTADAKLFVFAHKALAEWLFEVAKVSRLIGYVLADNISAIMMNREIGFVEWVRHPLLKEETSGDVQWRLGASNEPSPYGKYCYKIALSK